MVRFDNVISMAGIGRFIRHTGGIFAIMSIAGFFMLLEGESRAETLEDLKRMIGEKNAEILVLEQRSAVLRQELGQTQERGKTLSDEIARIRRSINTLKADIALTFEKLQRSNLEIEKAAIEIDQKQESIERLHRGLRDLVRLLFESERSSPLYILLSNPTLSDGVRTLDYGIQLKGRMVDTIVLLKSAQAALLLKKDEEEVEREEAETLKRQLAVREQALEADEREQATLLRLTKEKESAYQQILARQQKQSELLEQEIREIEAKIRIVIDPASLPPKGPGVLGFPLQSISRESCWERGSNAKNCVTQFFGYTDFAASGGYNGKGHNGVDFRADIGTPVFAGEGGIVAAVGDTDIGCRGASYGKWILIRHPNNLSTLYAHLAYIGAAPGQEVKRGMQMGLTGKTGYATGPHLHVGVFATQAVEVAEIRSKVCGRMMTLPVAAINGYLNPLDYM